MATSEGGDNVLQYNHVERERERGGEGGERQRKRKKDEEMCTRG